MQRYLLLFLFPMSLLGQDMGDLSGSVNFYYASRLSNSALINLPFRSVDVKWQGDMGAMSLYSHVALEYRMPNNSPSFSEAFQTENFTLDLRELYLTWYFENSEIRLGKQIHTWGSTDANSPIDNLSANDYYYMFSIGTEQKMGSYSIAADYYLNDWKFRLFFSPYHHVSRLPISDPEFPMELPANPTSKQILPVSDPMEFAGDITKSFNKGDVTFSYFNGYDRTFSPTAFNVWDNEGNNATVVKIDTIFSYRKTEVFGLGSVLFFGDLTFRGDIAYFTTKDCDFKFLELEYLGNNMGIYEQANILTDIREDKSQHFNTKAEYYQATIQFELSLPYDIQFVGQYITYDTLQYRDDLGFVDINLPSLDMEFTPAEYFFPGIGTGLAILTKEVVLVDVTKLFNDNSMQLSLKAMLDKVDSGKLFEMGINYKITESINSYFSITKIFGDSRKDDKYAFNHMQHFSHVRIEFKRYF